MSFIATGIKKSNVIPPTYRAKCLINMIDILNADDDLRHYLRTTEQTLYHYFGKTQFEYMDKCKQITFDLLKNPNLATKYSPNVITQLSSKKTKKKQQIEHTKTSNSTGFLICHKCKSKDIDWTQRQTRSADEAMTVFCECRQCGNRWKM